MTKTIARSAMALGLAGALGMAGTAQAAEAKGAKPDILEIKAPPAAEAVNTQEKQLQPALQASADLGNDYLARSRRSRTADVTTGGLLLLSGFYGAAVTAFNPAPKNLKAGILASATFGGLNSGLKFRDRSIAYRQGHRALACLVETGTPLMTYDTDYLQKVVDLRKKAADAFATADKALAADTNKDPPPPPDTKNTNAMLQTLLAHMQADEDAAKRKELEARMKVLSDLAKKLGEEAGAYDGAGVRATDVRRAILSGVDTALDGAAPDYAATAKKIAETPQAKAAPNGTAADGKTVTVPSPNAKFATDPKPITKTLPPTIAQALDQVNAAIRQLETDSPTAATKAFKAMGECIPKAG